MTSEVDIFVIAHNHLELTIECLDALYANTEIGFKLTVIDDSTDLTPLYMEQFQKEHDNVQYIKLDDPNLSGGQKGNLVMSKTNLDYIIPMSNSITVEPRWLDVPLALIKNYPDIGAVGFKDVTIHGLISNAGIVIGKNQVVCVGVGELGYRYNFIYEVDAIGCGIFNRKALVSIGGYDQGYVPYGGIEDVEVSLLLKEKGWKILYCGFSTVVHKHGSTMKESPEYSHRLAKNKQIFESRWHSLIERKEIPPLKVWNIGGV